LKNQVFSWLFWIAGSGLSSGKISVNGPPLTERHTEALVIVVLVPNRSSPVR